MFKLIMEKLGDRHILYPIDAERKKRVKIALAYRNISASYLAQEIGLSRFVVNRVINGRRRSRKAEQRIAEYLKEPLDYLFPQRTPKQIKKMIKLEAAE